tara:strand:+ start:55 stop:297 length:243 start_codon:yes stop_codon:yes gene_type:complete
MVSNLRVTVGVAASSAVLIIGTVWTLRGDLVTQAQLAAAVAAMDAKLGPVAGQIEKVADRVTDVDKRLSRIEGRMDFLPR